MVGLNNCAQNFLFCVYNFFLKNLGFSLVREGSLVFGSLTFFPLKDDALYTLIRVFDCILSLD